MKGMKNIKSFLLLALITCSVQACSFRSTQLDLLMTVFNGTEDEVPIEELAWTMIWSGNDFRLYPVFINPNDLSITSFINNENIIVTFDGWQVIRTDGLLPDDQNIEIVKTDAQLEYINQDGIIAIHQCEEFASTIQGQTTIWLQNCNSEEGAYTNEIRVNGAGLISLLRFLVHPDYPMLTLTPNNLAL